MPENTKGAYVLVRWIVVPHEGICGLRFIECKDDTSLFEAIKELKAEQDELNKSQRKIKYKHYEDFEKIEYNIIKNSKVIHLGSEEYDTFLNAYYTYLVS